MNLFVENEISHKNGDHRGMKRKYRFLYHPLNTQSNQFIKPGSLFFFLLAFSSHS